MERDQLLSLKVQSVEDVLWQLVQKWRADSNTDTLPSAVRLTTGYQTFSGYPVQIEVQRQNTWLTLYQPRTSGSSHASVRYIALPSISSVEVDLDLQTPLLFNAGQALPSEDQIPSKLNVDRTVASSQTALQQVGWKDVQLKLEWNPSDAGAAIRYRVTLILRSLPEIVQGLCKDEVGKQALSQIKSLTLRTDSSVALSATVTGADMQILIGSESNFAKIEKQLQELMEKAL